MPVVRTAVLLAAFPAGQPLNLHGNAPWYVSYFFSPTHGQTAYWLKQTDNDMLFTGEVFDWALSDDPAPDLSKRRATLDRVIRAMENDRGIDFSPFDVVVVVLGVRDGYPTDGGSAQATSRHRRHHGIVTRTGDRFDFLAHELGHTLGLPHSFGDPAFKDSGEDYGGYAHPYCVMSAMAYGGIGGPYFPATPRDGRPEYSGLGPSLNATTARGRGWIHADTYDLAAAGGPAEFTLRSRHWLGRAPRLAPQAVEVLAADGTNYVIEYREDADWDQGQASPALIVAQGRGSTGDAHYPDTFATTFLALRRLPITFGSWNSVYNGPGFGMEVIGRSANDHTLTIRLRPGKAHPVAIAFTDRTTTSREEEIGTGTTTWVPGEKLCVRGTWEYRELAREQQAVVEAGYPPGGVPVTVTWRVDGRRLTGTSGQLSLRKRVQVANPRLDPQEASRTVVVSYEIEVLPAGARLRLTNRPEDETYQLDVAATVSTSFGTAGDRTWIEFNGREYRYPQEFYDTRDACIRTYVEIGHRFAKSKVLLPPDLWRRIGEERAERVRQLTDVLARLHTVGDTAAYRRVADELGALVHDADVALTVVPLDEVAEVLIPDGPIPPPGHEVLPWHGGPPTPTGRPPTGPADPELRE
ncbi:reprolysin-like metallopeptidase [Kitasatospora misakiensis]|uniref:Reprolysin-like metallopeptidase n=1 Tax=Kitasatospora misakiensis TaxID=67330 RepID=A0ABW0X8Y8_9ACTN